MLVNGHADTRDIYHTFFDYHGYRTILADTGADALATLRGGCPDLVVMEHPMLVARGSDLLHAVRERGEPRRLRVLIVTALPTVPLARAWYDAMLAKPVRLDVLLSTVVQLIGPAPARRAEGPLPGSPH